jgi:hypothetical protein
MFPPYQWREHPAFCPCSGASNHWFAARKETAANPTNRERTEENWYTRGSRGGLTPTPIYSVVYPDDTKELGNHEGASNHWFAARKETAANPTNRERTEENWYTSSLLCFMAKRTDCDAILALFSCFLRPGVLGVPPAGRLSSLPPPPAPPLASR